jgi:hypothetical protein
MSQDAEREGLNMLKITNPGVTREQVWGAFRRTHDVRLRERYGVCVAMARKTGKFLLILLLVGVPERTQTTLRNGL